MKVWKYPLPVDDTADHFTVDLPAQFAELLTVQVQNGTPCLWAMVEPSAPKQTWHFHWVGTGHDIPEPVEHTDGRVYLGTVQLYDGALVLHLFHSGYDDTDGMST